MGDLTVYYRNKTKRIWEETQKSVRFVDNHVASSILYPFQCTAARLLSLLHLLYALRHTIYHSQKGYAPFSYCCHLIEEKNFPFTSPSGQTQIVS